MVQVQNTAYCSTQLLDLCQISFMDLTVRVTQGNYATQDSSGMCHLMPQWHLPEWREEDEWAFVHCGSSGLNHAITSDSATELSKVSSVTLY